jgi:hypothetical protein
MRAELWVVERHEGDGVWNIDLLVDCITRNMNMLLREGETNGYVPIAIFESSEDADNFIDVLKHKLTEQGESVG